MTLKVKWKNDIWLKVMGNCIAVLLEAVVKYTNTQSMKKRHFSRIKNGRENERCGIYEKISVSSGSLVCNKKWICYSGNLKISYYHASQTHKNFPWWTPRENVTLFLDAFCCTPLKIILTGRKRLTFHFSMGNDP